VLENLLYACLLENNQFTAADEAFARLEQYSDWNEVRVTTSQELCETAAVLGDPMPAIEHLKQVLHSLFETHYSFDLDFLIKENQGKAIAQLEKYKGMTPFVVSYLVQNSLGGHKIPTCSASLDLADALGLLTAKEKESGVVPGFERAVPKTKGPEFFSTMHQLAVDFKNKPRDKQVLACLKEINPESIKRLEAAEAAAKKANKIAVAEQAASTNNSSATPSSNALSSNTSAEKKPAIDSKATVDGKKSPPVNAKGPVVKAEEMKSTESKSSASGKKASPVAGNPSKSTGSGEKKPSSSSPPAAAKTPAHSAKPVAKPQEKPNAKPQEKPVAKPAPKKNEPTPPAKPAKQLKPAAEANAKKAPVSSKATPAKKKPR
jgi:hypothetical protein